MINSTATVTTTSCGLCTTMFPVQKYAFFVPAGGNANHAINLRCDTALVGLSFDFQWLTVNGSFTPCAAFPGFSVSNRIRSTITQ